MDKKLKFKSKGMQKCTYYYLGNNKKYLNKIKNKMDIRIAYYFPEERVN